MKWVRSIAGCLIVALMLAAPPTVCACPLCAEAIANSNDGSDEDDRDNFPAAMNQSIYLMLGVPYLAFGVVGLLIYHGVQKNEAYAQAVHEAAADLRSPA